MSTAASRFIRCDCCEPGSGVICAEHKRDRIVIKKRENRRTHVAVVFLDKEEKDGDNLTIEGE